MATTNVSIHRITNVRVRSQEYDGAKWVELEFIEQDAPRSPLCINIHADCPPDILAALATVNGKRPTSLADYTQDQVDGLSHSQIADRLRLYEHPLLTAAADSIDYLAAQEGLLEQAQQSAARANSALAEAKQPLASEMERLNERVIALNAENLELRRTLELIRAGEPSA